MATHALSATLASGVKDAEPNKWNKPLKLMGIEDDAKYIIGGQDMILAGDELMNIGLIIPELKGDYASKQWVLKKIEI